MSRARSRRAAALQPPAIVPIAARLRRTSPPAPWGSGSSPEPSALRMRPKEDPRSACPLRVPGRVRVPFATTRQTADCVLAWPAAELRPAAPTTRRRPHSARLRQPWRRRRNSRLGLLPLSANGRSGAIKTSGFWEPVPSPEPVRTGASGAPPSSAERNPEPSWPAIFLNSRRTAQKASNTSPVHAMIAPVRIKVLPKLRSRRIPNPTVTRPATSKPNPATDNTTIIQFTPGCARTGCDSPLPTPR